MKKLLVLLAICAFSTAAFADDDQAVISKDKLVKLQVPVEWESMDLNDAADLQVGNEGEESYLIVLNEVKEDLSGWNLEKHSRVTLGRLLSSITMPTVTGPKSLTIGGRPAVQYEIRGGSHSRNVVYLHTTVDGEQLFSQILAWTLPSKLDTAKPKLVKAINSWREQKAETP